MFDERKAQRSILFGDLKNLMIHLLNNTSALKLEQTSVQVIASPFLEL